MAEFIRDESFAECMIASFHQGAMPTRVYQESAAVSVKIHILRRKIKKLLFSISRAGAAGLSNYFPKTPKLNRVK
jgi:hypothetical protein